MIIGICAVRMRIIRRAWGEGCEKRFFKNNVVDRGDRVTFLSGVHGERL